MPRPRVGEIGGQATPLTLLPWGSGKLVSQRHLLTLQADYSSASGVAPQGGRWTPGELGPARQQKTLRRRRRGGVGRWPPWRGAKSQVLPQQKLRTKQTGNNRVEAAPGNSHPTESGVMKIRRQQNGKKESLLKRIQGKSSKGCPRPSQEYISAHVLGLPLNP